MEFINVFEKSLNIGKDCNGLTWKITCFEHFMEDKLLSFPCDLNGKGDFLMFGIGFSLDEFNIEVKGVEARMDCLPLFGEGDMGSF